MSDSEQTPGEGKTIRSPDRAAQLIAMAAELVVEMEQLAKDSGQQFTSLAKATHRNRVLIWTLMASLFLDVLITIVLGFVGVSTVDNTNRLDDVTADLQATQTDQRRRALCPLYGVLAGAESPEGKKRSALSPEEYDHAFEVINEGYDALGCGKFLEESGRNQW